MEHCKVVDQLNALIRLLHQADHDAKKKNKLIHNNNLVKKTEFVTSATIKAITIV